AVRRAAAVFTVSEASRAELVRAFGLAPERVTVVPEAPDPVFEPRPREAVARALGELGLGPDERIVVYAAGLSPHKNVETLLEAPTPYARSSSARSAIPSSRDPSGSRRGPRSPGSPGTPPRRVSGTSST